MRHLHLQYRGVATAPSPFLSSLLLEQPTLIKIAFMFGQETHIKFTPYASGRCFDYVCIVVVYLLPGCPVAWTFVRGVGHCLGSGRGRSGAWHSRPAMHTLCTCGHYSLFVAQLGSLLFPIAYDCCSFFSCCCCCCCHCCNAFLTLLILVLFCRVVSRGAG